MTGTDGRPVANDRFKQGFANRFWWGTAIAVVLHFMLFAWFPPMSVADVSFGERSLEAVDLPPDEVDLPPPPAQIARPAAPVISSDAEISEEITIAPTTFEENPIALLTELEPVAEAEDVLADYEAFTPSMVRPEVRNREEVGRRMAQLYPPVLRSAGIGGTTRIQLWLDESGQVQRAAVAGSSGYPLLDEASLRVIEVVQFSPAMNRDRHVRVRILWPITWRPVDRQ